MYSAVLLFSLSAGPPPPPSPGPPGSRAAIPICVCNKTTTTKNPGALGSALVQCLLPGPLPAVLALRAPRGECRGRPARLGTDCASAALRAAAGPTQGSSGTFSLCQQRAEKSPAVPRVSPSAVSDAPHGPTWWAVLLGATFSVTYPFFKFLVLYQ